MRTMFYTSFAAIVGTLMLVGTTSSASAGCFPPGHCGGNGGSEYEVYSDNYGGVYADQYNVYSGFDYTEVVNTATGAIADNYNDEDDAEYTVDSDNFGHVDADQVNAHAGFDSTDVTNSAAGAISINWNRQTSEYEVDSNNFGHVKANQINAGVGVHGGSVTNAATGAVSENVND